MIPKLNIHFKAVCRNYKCCYLPHLYWTQTPEGILPKARRNDRNQAHVHPCLPARDKQHWKLPAFSHQAPLPHRSSKLLSNDQGFSREHPSSQEYGACRQDLGFHEWILDTCWSSWMGSRQLWYVYLSFPSHFLRIAPHTSSRQIQRHLLSIPWRKKKKEHSFNSLACKSDQHVNYPHKIVSESHHWGHMNTGNDHQRSSWLVTKFSLLAT